MARLTGEGTICFAQHVLDYYDITIISASGLGELLNMKRMRAAYILSQLGWERICNNANLYLWQKNGSHKHFEAMGTGRRLFNIWKRRNDIQDDI